MKKAPISDPELGGRPGGRRRRGAFRIAAIAASALVLLGACSVAWWMRLASCLPEYATMRSGTGGEGHATVARRLFEVGAFALRGKIYNVWGREVIFFPALVAWGGAPPRFSERDYERRKEQSDALRAKHHTVIEVFPPPSVHEEQ
jgi:hypothetical protein